MLTGETAVESALLVNTTIGVVATDASLDKMQVNFVASAAHDGLALTMPPLPHAQRWGHDVLRSDGPTGGAGRPDGDRGGGNSGHRVGRA